MEDRKEILLKASYDILKKCSEGMYVFEATAKWDEATYDGYCLMEDIKDELNLEDE